MNTNIWGKRFLTILGSALIGLIFATGANALNPEPATVSVEFVAAITISKTNDLRFGLLDDAMADTELIIITPAGGITDAGNNIVGGTQGQATFATTAAPSKLIFILVDNVNTPALSGYALTAWQCDYDGDVAGGGACDSGNGLSETSVPGSTEVRVGVTLTHDATAATGSKPSTFDLTITYQ